MAGDRPATDADRPANYAGAIDCDLHPALPGMSVLLPYLDEYWREMVSVRALDRLNLSLTSYPQNAPLSCRPDWKLDRDQKPGSSLEAMQAHVLDRYQPRFGILNCLYGAQVMHSEDMAAVLCRATNDWIRDHWLSRDPRLRASIVIAAHNTELAVAEIERRADDLRFVQVLMLVSGEVTLGRRQLWPIYRLAERLGLPIGVHAGSAYRYAPTAVGWPSYYVEDYVSQSAAFENQLQSMISEGVFAKFPGPQGGRHRVGSDLVERLCLARGQDLEGRTGRGALGDARAVGNRPQPCPLHGSAGRCAGRGGSDPAADRAS